MHSKQLHGSMFAVAWLVMFQDELGIKVKSEDSLRKSTMHPLDPLSESEISGSSNLVKKDHFGESLLFISITLLEPPKSILAPVLRSSEEASRAVSIPRKSVAIYYNTQTGVAYKTIVNLTKKVLESSRKLPLGIQPSKTSYEADLAFQLALADPRIKERLKKLGLDPRAVHSTGPNSAGFNQLDPAFPGKRIIQSMFGFENFKHDNFRAHPLDFRTLVDIVERKVIEIHELPEYRNGSSTPVLVPLTTLTLPRESANYEPDVLGPNFYRKDVRPLQVTSVGGPAFRLRGYKLLWQKFGMRLSFNPREGLVIHDITYKDGSKVRPLIYRASISEMVVPYGDARDPKQYHSTFDEGFRGLGAEGSIQPNIECFPDGQRMSVVLSNVEGQPLKIENVICIHEEDGGILYKHTYSGKTTVARSRVLVVHYVTTIGNYDYGFYWRFHQDATISHEVGLTGLLSTDLNRQGYFPYASRILPKVEAQYHQHLFSARLDTDFDGETNTVSMLDVFPAPDSENAPGNGFMTMETVFNTSLDSVTDTNILTGRTWKISNPNSINPVTGRPVAWKLVPQNRKLLLAKPGSLVYNTAGFAAHAIWVTPYRDQELFAAGEFPYLSKGGHGLPKWVKRNEPIVDRDVVVYHTFGVTHIPRLEDFPLMPMERVGFTLKPLNFFTSFPGLDVPNTV